MTAVVTAASAAAAVLAVVLGLGVAVLAIFEGSWRQALGGALLGITAAVPPASLVALVGIALVAVAVRRRPSSTRA